MSLQINKIKHQEWFPLPFDGCMNVYVKSLHRTPYMNVAMLRFDENAQIHEHDATIDIDVICIEGQGFVSVDGEESAFQAGEKVHWPAHKNHQLWTKNTTMVTLMLEHAPKEETE